MKAFKFLIFFSVSILFLAGCEKDDCNCGENIEDFQLTSDYLKQTIWNGKIWYALNEEVVSEGYINIQFSTNKRGKYEFKYDDDKDRTIEDFQYQISDRLFVITADVNGRYPWLSGDWLIVSQSKSKIILVQDGYMEEGVSTNIELNIVDL